MGYEQISDGVTITVPTSTTTGWAQQLKALAWKPLSGHDHTGAGKGTTLSTAAIADNAITGQKLAKNIYTTQASTLTPSGTTQTINFNDGNKQILDLSSASGNVTVTLSNPIAGAIYRIKIIQGATARTIVWPASVKWAGSVEPTQHQNANTINVVYLDYDGTYFLTLWDNDL